MWNEEKVRQIRPYCQVTEDLSFLSKDEYLKELKNLSEYSATTDRTLTQYIINLQKGDAETAYALNYIKVNDEGLIKTSIRAILGFLMVSYCLPFTAVITISGYEKKKTFGIRPLYREIIDTLLAVILSTAFYFSFLPFWKWM